MGITTCYSPYGSEREIRVDDGVPNAEPGFVAASAVFEDDEDYLADLPAFEHVAPRRSVLRGAARALLSVSATVACVTAFNGLTARGEASVPDASDEVAMSNLSTVPERIAQAPRLVEMGPADKREWEAFRTAFVTAEGRVIDTGNKGVSHTEGQGWGMLFAVAFDDALTFERLYSWTRRNLSRPDDALHAWRYVPGEVRPVADTNNATDGDVFIALALWRAAYRWGRADHAMTSRAMARDILRLLVREAGPRTVLLPAAFGFEHGGNIDVNPSYYSFAAFRELAEALPSPIWQRLETHGLQMISEGRFGRWRLPPDWLSVGRRDGALTPAAGWPARFSYDAIRVPLHLSWAGLAQPEVSGDFTRFWHETSPLPAWVDLRSGAFADYPAPPGIAAVAKIATATAKTALPGDFPTIRATTDYYSAALILLARLAWREGLRV